MYVYVSIVLLTCMNIIVFKWIHVQQQQQQQQKLTNSTICMKRLYYSAF